MLMCSAFLVLCMLWMSDWAYIYIQLLQSEQKQPLLVMSLLDSYHTCLKLSVSHTGRTSLTVVAYFLL